MYGSVHYNVRMRNVLLRWKPKDASLHTVLRDSVTPSSSIIPSSDGEEKKEEEEETGGSRRDSTYWTKSAGKGGQGSRRAIVLEGGRLDGGDATSRSPGGPIEAGMLSRQGQGCNQGCRHG